MERCVTEFSRDLKRPLRTAGRWPSAAVFDCDGLLLDTTACWHLAYRSVAIEMGASLDGVDLDRLNGASVALAADRLERALRKPVAQAWIRRMLRESVETLPIAAMPGAHRLLALLAAEMPLAVATNAPLAVVATALRRAGLGDFFSTIVSAEQMPSPKPQPDVYLEACRRLNVDPSDAVAFEDSALGAAAARAAALLVVAVPSVRGAQMDADLTVGRLDDLRVLELLGLADPADRRSESAMRGMR
jgi:HAD superfamily hydrolase (TIGR01509 family)